MTTAKVASAIFNLTSIHGLDLGGGRSIKLAEKTRLDVRDEGEETVIDFTPAAIVGQTILGILSQWSCPRMRFGEHSLRVEIDGWPDQTIDY